MEYGYEILNSPEQYEREKATRIFPEDLKEWHPYTVRLLMPPSSKDFAKDVAAVIIDIERDDGLFKVGMALNRFRNKFEPEAVDFWFNSSGFIRFDGSEPGTEIEIGYVLGEIDEADLELVELIEASQTILTSM